ncbi:MAG: NAD(P)-dependent oxidoreductase [Candidatus Nanopelagicales bacterium]
MASVAVLGIGRMGAAMSSRLVDAGHSVSVWNRSPAAGEALAARCAVRVAATPAEAVAGAELVISILANGAVTEAVLLDPAVLAALAPGTVVCDLGTSGVATAHRLGAALSSQGARFVDSPVSGSVPTVLAGQLLVMASGGPEGVAAASPVLAAFAKKVAYLGPAGRGQAMKLAVNLVVFALNSAVGEALALARAAGVDPSDAYDVLQDSVVAAPLVRYKRAAFLDPDAPVAMSLDLALKDLDLITGFAEELGSPVPATRAVRDEVADACAAGYGDRDMAQVFRYLTGE